MTGFIDYIKAYYRVCRLEYAPGEIPAILTVLFLGSATVSRFFALPVLEAMVAFLLLYLSGFIINAIADKEIDKKYDTFKTSIPKSVDLLGENTLKALIVTHVIIAMVLAFHITLQMNSIIPIALVLIGVFFGLGYSVKPFHFKTRGVWHGIALGSSAFFLPFIFLMYVVAGGLTLPLLLFIIGFSFVHYGMEFGNQAIDYIEDKAANVRTPPVRWGMIPSLIIALGCVVSGIVTEAASLYYILLSKGSFTFLHPVLTTNVVYVVLLGIILTGYYIPTKGLWQMLSTLRKSKTVEEGMPTLKKICSYAKWQASGILGVAIVSGILFMGMIYSPAANLHQNIGDGNGNYVGLLKMASEPEVEFFQDDGNWNANVSVSVLNDNILREKRSIMIEVQSWVANFPLRAEWLILEENLMPNEYWNVSAKIRAHDIDDTTIIIYLYALIDQNVLNKIQIGDPWIEPSKKDLYIYNVKVEPFDDILHDKKANVTVTVFNEGVTRNIGDLEVEVFYYYGLYSDYQSVKNDYAIHSIENWIPTLTVDALALDEISEPIFVVKLFFEDVYIDEYTFSGYD
ncbi:MAG: UbiA family prenyltransferase [Thermoplasmata archaeon]